MLLLKAMTYSTTIHHWLNSVMISIVLMLVLNGQSLALRQEGDVDYVAQATLQTAGVSIGQSHQDNDMAGAAEARLDGGRPRRPAAAKQRPWSGQRRPLRGLSRRGSVPLGHRKNATVSVDQPLTVHQDDDVDLVTQTTSVSVDRSQQDNDGMDLVAPDVRTTTSVSVGQSHTLSHGEDAHIQATEAKKSWILTYPNYFVLVAAGVVLIAVIIICFCCCCCACCRRVFCGCCGSCGCCCRRSKDREEDLESGLKMKEKQKVESPTKVSKGKHRGKKQEKEETESAAEPEGESAFEPPEEYEDQDEYSRGVRHFLHKYPQYTTRGPLRPLDLGSRMQKYWYKIESTGEEKLLTIAPVSQNCPLLIHKRQKGLNKLIEAVRVHPYLHPIEVVDYLVDHQLLVMVQPLVHSGSLKDMIYKTMPLTDWSKKYARRSKGLANDKIARYGRHILEAMKFLYDKEFPYLQLGHVQSGNIFVVDDVCRLGGYENTLLGYRTRLFRLCKDHLQHFDIILFGHTVFEMAAGYELTHLRPSQADYKAVDKKIRPVLEFIFEQGFPHSISEISSHDFFGASLTELSDFDADEVKISDSAMEVLNDVRKAKPRVQKAPKPLKPSTPASSSAKSKGFFSSIELPKWRLSSKKGKSKEEEEMEMKGLLDGKED